MIQHGIAKLQIMHKFMITFPFPSEYFNVNLIIFNEAVRLRMCYWYIVDLPSQDNSTLTGSSRLNPLHLANALAACVLSSRLTYTHRQWAIEQLVRSLSALAKDPAIGEERL